MRVCGLDFETTGFDFEKDFVTEIGAIAFDSDTWEPLEEFSMLVHEPRALPLKPEIVKITGITDEQLRTSGADPLVAFTAFTEFCGRNRVEGFIAHHAEFDKTFLLKEMKRLGFGDSVNAPFLCSKADVKTHADKACKRLSHLALDYGLTVDGSKLHRAIEDVRIMGKMLQKAGMTFTQIKEYKEEPWVYLQALVSYDNKEDAKKDGYSWERIYGASDSPVFQKSWVKRIKQSDAEKERQKNVPFKRQTIFPTA